MLVFFFKHEPILIFFKKNNFLIFIHRNSLRRIATNDDTEFSRESIVNLMERFVKTVNVMDETILVPCRLMDRTVRILIFKKTVGKKY